MSEARQYADLAIYRRLLQQARSFWPHIALLFLLSLLSMPVTLLSPIPLKLVVDCVLGPKEFPPVLAAVLPAGTPRTDVRAIALVAALFVLIALVKQLADLAFAALRTYAGEKLVLSFRAHLFRHTQRLSLSYHDSKGTTDSTYRIQYDAPAIQWISIDAFIPLVTAAFTLVAMLYVIVRIDWHLALVALTIAPILFMVSQLYSKRLKVQWREAKDLESSAFSLVQEVLSSVRVVKAFSQEDREQARYVQRASRNLREQVRLTLMGGSFGLIVGVAIALGTAIVLLVGARHAQTGAISLGELILVMSYLAMLYAPLQTLSKSATSLQGSLVSAERCFALLDQAPEVVERPNARPLGRTRGSVAFQHVSFAYTAERKALQDISFEVPVGSRVGIAGTTGAGKSTLVSLLLRLYDPQSGRILLDGVDLRDYRLRDLRNQFAIVLQEPVLFSTSIAENIAYARPEAGEREIIAAAQAANAHEFILGLPQGYKTPVGERGVQLSGGERQRISLARAFLKDAPILILDEPTSAVDVKTEALILEAMERLMQGRTTFMIAHRLSTLDICNVRLRLESGRLVSANGCPMAEEQSAATSF
jgi:ATP-binding cassette subfamily B protein